MITKTKENEKIIKKKKSCQKVSRDIKQSEKERERESECRKKNEKQKKRRGEDGEKQENVECRKGENERVLVTTITRKKTIHPKAKKRKE